MKDNMLIDGHCDTIERMLDLKTNLEDVNLAINLKQASQNLPYIQCFATFVHDVFVKQKQGFKRAKDILDYFYKEYDKHKRKMQIVVKKEQLISKELEKKWGVILTIENGGAIDDDLDNIDMFYDMGVRIMSITWNGENSLGCGALTNIDTGLSKLGKEYIKRLEKSKIGIDVSHLSEKSFWDVNKIITKPIIASHSCCKSLCNHKRNLSDEQIKEIAKSNGIIGVNYCNLFLSQNGNASSSNIADHIQHISNLVGVDYVGLGSDFDGIDKGNEVRDVHTLEDIHNIKEQLEKRGFSKDEINKIMGENWKRVLKEILTC